MKAVGKKFGPLVERGSLWLEKYAEFFKGTEPAPTCHNVEGCCPLMTYPLDVMGDVPAPERLNMTAE